MNTRRHFVATSTAAALAAATPPGTRLPIRKGVLLSMLPSNLSFADRFRLAADCGYETVEAYTVDDDKTAEEIKKAAELAKIPIHSVMNQEHWRSPLSSPDPAVVEKSMAGMRTSLKNAHFWGATTVLLVPAVVDAKTSYADAWTRSQKQIRQLLPLAKDLKVTIAVENVWNKFLLSPLEMARYVDEFKSPYLKAYFDVGNVVLFGYPQDWIRTLGKRIAKLHLKDFKFRGEAAVGNKRVADFCNLREGDIDWLEIHQSLSDIGYQGVATVELNKGEAAYLKEVSRRVDLILTAAPKES